MTNQELLTFILVTYKNFDGIYDTLNSLFEQDYPRIELIWTDDGSPNINEVKDEVKKYIDDHRKSNIVDVQYNLREKNGGTIKNLNSAICLANGEYIKILGADDTFNNVYALSTYIKALDNSENLVVFSKLQGVTEKGDIIQKLSSCYDDYDALRNSSPNQILNKLFNQNFLPGPAACFKKEIFKKYGYFDERILLIEDYSYWINLSLKGVKFKFIDDILINYKLSGISSAGNYSSLFIKDLFNIYNYYIFPNDHRFGLFQGTYNQLKKDGLNTYLAIANWKNYPIWSKIKKIVRYFPFFIYIKVKR